MNATAALPMNFMGCNVLYECKALGYISNPGAFALIYVESFEARDFEYRGRLMLQSSGQAAGAQLRRF